MGARLLAAQPTAVLATAGAVHATRRNYLFDLYSLHPVVFLPSLSRRKQGGRIDAPI